MSTNDTLTLPLPARRLIELILESDGEILTREFLFVEVWDKYGLRSSNSNLNQYMSILRRSLVRLGCDNFIVTLPTVGIRLSENVLITKEDLPEIPHIINPENVNALEEKYSFSKMKIVSLFLVCLLIVIIFGIIRYGMNDDLDPVTKVVNMDGGCELVMLKTYNDSEVVDVTKQVTAILHKNNLTCQTGKRVYFDSYASSSLQSYGRTMLSYCSVGNKGNNISCENAYYLDWSGDEH
jgi:DNA-binding winged helix-turn-helix (wHTH) protein